MCNRTPPNKQMHSGADIPRTDGSFKFFGWIYFCARELSAKPRKREFAGLLDRMRCYALEHTVARLH